MNQCTPLPWLSHTHVHTDTHIHTNVNASQPLTHICSITSTVLSTTMGQLRALKRRSARHLRDIREETSLANSSPTVRRLHSWLMALHAPRPCLHGSPRRSPPLQPRSLSPFSPSLPPQVPYYGGTHHHGFTLPSRSPGPTNLWSLPFYTHYSVLLPPLTLILIFLYPAQYTDPFRPITHTAPQTLILWYLRG